MMRRVAAGVMAALVLGPSGTAAAQVKTAAGPVEGTTSADGRVRVFKGIPFAAPPVGDARWKAPAPAAAWTAVKKTVAFGPRCAQGRIFGDMVFRDEMSEDCLYLNVWTPAAKAGEKLPVMFWIHGGGFQAGSASEPRQDGEQLARKGVVVVSANHRLGVFGFLAHPELSQGVGSQRVGQLRAAQSGRGAAVGARQHRRVRRRPGQRHDLRRVGGIVCGERAGGVAARQGAGPHAPSAKAARSSPWAAGRSARRRWPRRGTGRQFATGLGAADLAALRAKTTDEVLQSALKGQWFAPIVDGYVLPQSAAEIYAAGGHNHVPLLAGWNADEIRPA